MSYPTHGGRTQMQRHISRKRRTQTQLNLPDSKLAKMARNPYRLPATTLLGRPISHQIGRQLRAPGVLYSCSRAPSIVATAWPHSSPDSAIPPIPSTTTRARAEAARTTS
eukprot:4011267-Pleurochrysis_carterae.AAC.1